MTHTLSKTQITLDPKADHNLDKSTTSGEVYIFIKSVEDGKAVEKSIEFYFEADSDHDVTLLSMGDVLEDPDGAQNDSTYQLNDSDEFEIQILIKKWIESQIEDESGEDYYDGHADHGMRNSDFLYGYHA